MAITLNVSTAVAFTFEHVQDDIGFLKCFHFLLIDKITLHFELGNCSWL